MPTKHRVSRIRISTFLLVAIFVVPIAAVIMAATAIMAAVSPNSYHAGSPHVTAAGVISFGPQDGTYHDI
jgi:hypothetical protein